MARKLEKKERRANKNGIFLSMLLNIVFKFFFFRIFALY